MPIHWREELNIGIHALDSQHQYLVSLINVIEAAGNCDLDRDLFLTHLAQLEAYTHYHFEFEEGLQRKNNYAHLETHKLEHAKLIERLKDMIETTKKETSEHIRAKQMGKVFEFLRSWLVDHLIGEDMKMKGAFHD